MASELARAVTSRVPVERPSWTVAAVASGAVVAVAWSLWTPPTLFQRVLRDAALYGVLSVVLVAVTDGNAAGDLGWTVDREAVRAAAGLTLFVLPFYVVGASLPTMRAAYPLWETGAALPAFLPHALGIVAVVALAETYYRGLLCVGLRHLGPWCVLVHLPVYVFIHLSNPAVETAMSALAGLLFGAVAYRTESVLPTVVAHGVGWVVLDFLVVRPPLVPWVGDVLPL